MGRISNQSIWNHALKSFWWFMILTSNQYFDRFCDWSFVQKYKISSRRKIMQIHIFQWHPSLTDSMNDWMVFRVPVYWLNQMYLCIRIRQSVDLRRTFTQQPEFSYNSIYIDGVKILYLWNPLWMYFDFKCLFMWWFGFWLQKVVHERPYFMIKQYTVHITTWWPRYFNHTKPRCHNVAFPRGSNDIATLEPRGCNVQVLAGIRNRVNPT